MTDIKWHLIDAGLWPSSPNGGKRKLRSGSGWGVPHNGVLSNLNLCMQIYLMLTCLLSRPFTSGGQSDSYFVTPLGN
jgi:hypothetical protein